METTLSARLSNLSPAWPFFRPDLLPGAFAGWAVFFLTAVFLFFMVGPFFFAKEIS